MAKLNWKDWFAVVVVAVVVAGLAFASLLEVQHLKQDEANLHALIPLINFNLATHRLDLPPGPESVTPPVVAAPAPKPPDVKKP